MPRTTVTLDSDVEALVRRLMKERGLTFKAAVNEAIRRGLAAPADTYTTPAFHMGTPALGTDKALQLAGQLEDEELTRKLAARK
ncbi:MAG TPA: hypothetical protein VM307_00830 [Egibacteraceae bacterium]|nr:hypothetical protein [Egibacteraceae bacterium]